MFRIRQQYHDVSVVSLLLFLLLPIHTKSFTSSLSSTSTHHVAMNRFSLSVLFSVESKKRFHPKKSKAQPKGTKKTAATNNKKYNHNLHQQVKKCSTIEGIIALCENNKDSITPSDVSFCWSQLYRLLLSDYREVTKINQDPTRVLTPLLDQTIETCGRMNPRSLATTTHRIAKISFRARTIDDHNKSKIWTVLEKRALKMTRINSMEISNIVWAFVKVKRNAPAVFDHFANQNITHVKEFNSQAISNLLWSYAKVRHTSPALFDAVAEEAIKKIDTFKSQEISNTLWSYATVGHPSPELFDAAAEETIKKLNTFKSQALCTTLWSYAKIGRQAPELFGLAEREAIQKLDTFNHLDISNTLWSYATIGHYSSPELFNAAARETMKKLNTFKSQALSSALWSYAKVSHSCPELFDAAAEEVMLKLNAFNAEAISNMLWSYATMGRSSPTLFDAAAEEAMKKLKTFKSQHISNTLWAYATVGRSSPELFDLAAEEAARKLDSFKPHEMSNTLWSMAVQDCNVESAIPLLNRVIDLYQSNPLCLSSDEKRQIHQVILWFSKEHGHTSPLPDTFANSCLSVFTKNPTKLSNFQKEVFSIFRSLGFEVLDKDLCKQTGYSIDAIVKSNDGNETAVEVDGPTHFIQRMPTGSTILKRRQLNTLGSTPLLSVPYFVWNNLGSTDEKKKFLEEEIETLVSKTH